MTRRTALLALAAAMAAAVPSGADAAYSPTLELTFDRYEPAIAPAVTAVMRQQSGEDTTRTIAARFPPEFTLNPAFAVSGCTPAREQSDSCPPESRLGAVSIMSSFGPASGTLFLAEDFRIVASIQALGGLVRQRLTGRVRALDDGSPEVVFDDLPAVPVTESRIALDGGPRSIFITPRRCGRHEVGARFVSHDGAEVKMMHPLEIVGCPTPLRVAAVRIASGSDGKTIVRWRLTTAAAYTTVELYRRSRGAWRSLGVVRATGAAGRHRITVSPHWRGRRLRVGRHRVALRAITGDGAVSPARYARFAVGR